jgi:pyridoxamine 5'-phosphate oxidase
MPTPTDPAQPFALDETLPDPLPADPMPTLASWLDYATREKIQPNPNAIALATVDPNGRPSSRIVLCKSLEAEPGAVVFYSNKNSRKGRALAANPHAAITFHWDDLDRQARVEGPVTHVSDAEADAYFASRHPASRVGAWASDQSQPITSRDDLLGKVMTAMQQLDVDFDTLEDGGDVHIPRPPHWGGYRVWAQRVELWVGSPVRIHDRAEWTRQITPTDDGFSAGEWSSTRVQP